MFWNKVRSYALAVLVLGVLLMFSRELERSNPVILCFGDSLTEGYMVSGSESYPARLQKRLTEEGYRYRVVNAGISGETTEDGLYRIGAALRHQPKIVILALGANDAYQGVRLSVMRSNLTQLITGFQQAGALVVLAGLPVLPWMNLEEPAGFATLYQELAQQFATPLLPSLLHQVSGYRALNLEDGLHPNGAGYRQVMENVWFVLEPLLHK